MRDTLGAQTYNSINRQFDAHIATAFADFCYCHEVQVAKREKFDQFPPIRKPVLDTFEVTTAMTLPVGEIGPTDEIATLGSSKITPSGRPTRRNLPGPPQLHPSA